MKWKREKDVRGAGLPFSSFTLRTIAIVISDCECVCECVCVCVFLRSRSLRLSVGWKHVLCYLSLLFPSVLLLFVRLPRLFFFFSSPPLFSLSSSQIICDHETAALNYSERSSETLLNFQVNKTRGTSFILLRAANEQIRLCRESQRRGRSP